MTFDKGSPGDYVQKVRDDTRQYIQDLLAENERLRGLLASYSSSGDDPEPAEKQELREQIKTLRQELAEFQAEQGRMSQLLAEVEAENKRFSAQYVEVEQQNNNLANLYVASYRLHETMDRQEVLEAIQEILINLVGTEEILIYERPAGQDKIELTVAFGVDAENFETPEQIPPQVQEALDTGETYTAGDVGRLKAGEPSACVPLRLGKDRMGAIVLFSLLEQKPGFEDLDRELFELLATHAAPALLLSSTGNQPTATSASG